MDMSCKEKRILSQIWQNIMDNNIIRILELGVLDGNEVQSRKNLPSSREPGSICFTKIFPVIWRPNFVASINCPLRRHHVGESSSVIVVVTIIIDNLCGDAHTTSIVII